MAGEPVDNTEPTEPETDSAGHTLDDAVKAAVLLVAFAAENGKDVDTEHIETIVQSKHILTTRALDEAEESKFWSAYRDICNAIKPVTHESLRATTIQLRPRRFLPGMRNVSVANGAVRYYQAVTISSIFVLLVVQIYWVFVSTVVTDLKRLRIEEVSFTEKSMTQEAEIRDLRSTIAGDAEHEHDEHEKILEQISKLELERKKSDYYGAMSVEFRSQYNANIRILRRANIIDRFFASDRDFDYEAEDEFEDDEYVEGDEFYAIEEIYEYDPFDYEKSDPLLIQTGAISLEVLSLYLLPILYGLVGACAYILRTISEQLRERTFTSTSKIRLQLRMVLGALAGFSVAWFTKGEGDSGLLQSLTPLALAFLAGYGVELLFSAMDTFIDAFSREHRQD